jgi:hypothetical protein
MYMPWMIKYGSNSQTSNTERQGSRDTEYKRGSNPSALVVGFATVEAVLEAYCSAVERPDASKRKRVMGSTGVSTGKRIAQFIFCKCELMREEVEINLHVKILCSTRSRFCRESTRMSQMFRGAL